jgi:hypothetical protein
MNSSNNNTKQYYIKHILISLIVLSLSSLGLCLGLYFGLLAGELHKSTIWHRYTIDITFIYGKTSRYILDLPKDSKLQIVLENERYILMWKSPLYINRSLFKNSDERAKIKYDVNEYKIINIDSSRNYIIEKIQN